MVNRHTSLPLSRRLVTKPRPMLIVVKRVAHIASTYPNQTEISSESASQILRSHMTAAQQQMAEADLHVHLRCRWGSTL